MQVMADACFMLSLWGYAVSARERLCMNSERTGRNVWFSQMCA